MPAISLCPRQLHGAGQPAEPRRAAARAMRALETALGQSPVESVMNGANWRSASASRAPSPADVWDLQKNSNPPGGEEQLRAAVGEASEEDAPGHATAAVELLQGSDLTHRQTLYSLWVAVSSPAAPWHTRLQLFAVALAVAIEGSLAVHCLPALHTWHAWPAGSNLELTDRGAARVPGCSLC
ncbi:hypothetical protein CC78DRAFT_575553 [Lojkania enalia]|uniref:Uncharacterized protein n=1 Tax=Lojkania enalia TaxID=147567 RepID=A0A9P4TPR3_9PLEO|nr:hypothetical protein CC78DRAFT_575553 [Didymosphaeria enalia]